MLNPLTQPAGPLNSKEHIETHAAWLGLRRCASTPDLHRPLCLRRPWTGRTGHIASRASASLLLLNDEWGTADPLALEVDINLDAVRDSYKGDAAVHAEVLAIEGHCPFNLA
jgi:hypothetical protein